MLRLGRGSRFATSTSTSTGRPSGGRVLLPVLGGPLAEVLAAGGLSVVEPGRAGRSWPTATSRSRSTPPAGGGPAAPASGAALLTAQHYRLAYWRLGRRQGNYRRFFDVDGLVGVRVEDPEVYEADAPPGPRAGGRPPDRRAPRRPHRRAGRPGGYLDRLRRASAVRRLAGGPGGREDPGPGRGGAGAWATDGTTGYEFADVAVGCSLSATPRGRPDGVTGGRPARRRKRPDPPRGRAGQARGARRALRARARGWPPTAGRPRSSPADMSRAEVTAVRRARGRTRVYRTYCRTRRGTIRGCGPPAPAGRGRRAGMHDEGRRPALWPGGPGRPGPRDGSVAGRLAQVAQPVAAADRGGGGQGRGGHRAYRFGGLVARAEVGGLPDERVDSPASTMGAPRGSGAGRSTPPRPTTPNEVRTSGPGSPPSPRCPSVVDGPPSDRWDRRHCA